MISESGQISTKDQTKLDFPFGRQLAVRVSTAEAGASGVSVCDIGVISALSRSDAAWRGDGRAYCRVFRLPGEAFLAQHKCLRAVLVS